MKLNFSFIQPEKGFAFRGIFDKYVTTQDIFEATVILINVNEEYQMSNKIKKLLKGFNLTCFAYGMTGSGKTYSMFGSGQPEFGGSPGLCWLSVNKFVL